MYILLTAIYSLFVGRLENDAFSAMELIDIEIIGGYPTARHL